MKLNKKGMTLIEIIISITLISIIIVFLLSIFITIRNENNSSKVVSDLLINQALITKEIETDFIELRLNAITDCEPINDLKNNYIIHKSVVAGGYKCLKFTFSASSDVGYLLYYTYQIPEETDPVNVVGYRRGTKSTVRKTNQTPSGGTVSYKCTGGVCPVIINLPVYSEDGDDYGIHLSYIYNGNDFSGLISNEYIF